jgi:MFS family permease
VNLLRNFSLPATLSETERKNYSNVQIDAIGVGLASAAAPFLPVFLTHLNATSFQVGLLSSMPAITGLLLSIPLGRFLQRQPNIVRWFSIARLTVIACYALTGFASFFLPDQAVVIAILAIWALATIPQTIVAITFSVVMNAVAGPSGRFELMTRRWSVLGITTTICVLGIGQLLDRVVFPLNYQIMFIVLSLGGLISYYYSSHISIPFSTPPGLTYGKRAIKEQVKEYKDLILSEKPYLSFIIKRFIFLTGTALAAPLIPLYLVRVVHASDGWISIINTVQTAVLVLGYFVWTRQSRKHGPSNVLIWTSLGVALYPLAMSLSQSTWQISAFAAMAGIFQAGLDLVFFDELMRTVPVEYSAIFVSFAQSIQYLSSVFAPVIGTTIGDSYGLGVGLMISAAFRLLGFLLFLWPALKQRFNRRKISA